MEEIIYSNSLYQINEILKYISPNLKARIPQKYITYFEINKSDDYNWNIDKTVPLEKQDLLPIAKEILTFLYRDYICNDEERAILDKTLNENEIKYQSELKEKYSADNIFKDRKCNPKNERIENENTSIVTYKESFFSKIINKIKLIFSK